MNDYVKNAADYCARYDAMKPTELWAVMDKHFLPFGRSLDIGSGSGRDTHFLRNLRGHQVIGVDSTLEMIECARKTYPDLTFIHDSLPTLSKIKELDRFHNILCSGVIHHISSMEELYDTVRTITELLYLRGTAIISWRSSINNNDPRDFHDWSELKVFSLFEFFECSLVEFTINENWKTAVFKKGD